MTSSVYIALGSNLGSRLQTFNRAVSLLGDEGLEVGACSSLYETAAVGGPSGQRDYLNAVIAAETTLPPRRLLKALHDIERRCGRRRGVRNAPRTLDLDLLLYEDRVLEEPGLTVPHPGLHLRAFVLRPLCDVAPGVVHPVFGVPACELLARLECGGQAVRAVAGPEWLQRPQPDNT